eukprot:4945039-Pyramimonas_sp.AAC.1
MCIRDSSIELRAGNCQPHILVVGATLEVWARRPWGPRWSQTGMADGKRECHASPAYSTE